MRLSASILLALMIVIDSAYSQEGIAPNIREAARTTMDAIYQMPNVKLTFKEMEKKVRRNLDTGIPKEVVSVITSTTTVLIQGKVSTYPIKHMDIHVEDNIRIRPNIEYDIKNRSVVSNINTNITW